MFTSVKLACVDIRWKLCKLYKYTVIIYCKYTVISHYIIYTSQVLSGLLLCVKVNRIQLQHMSQSMGNGHTPRRYNERGSTQMYSHRGDFPRGDSPSHPEIYHSHREEIHHSHQRFTTHTQRRFTLTPRGDTPLTPRGDSPLTPRDLPLTP